MKKTLFITSIAFAALLSLASTAHAEGGVSFGLFYSSLGSYGEWISVDADMYAWRPLQVAADWRPYTVGRWVWTDEGWYWASDEPWGWAAYHYGRWYYDDFYGWVWVPGYDWAPAWVEWRYGGDYVGWAPLSPYAVFSYSWGIHYRRHWVTPYSYWSFVDCQYLGHSDINRYVYRSENNTRFIGRTRGAGSVHVDGGRVVTRGPDRAYVERRGNVRIERADIADARDRQGERIVRDGNRERIEVYRPRFEGQTRSGETDRPARLRTGERPLSLDTRNTDVRSRDIGRAEGRDLRRTEEFRRLPDRRPDDLPTMAPRRLPDTGRRPDAIGRTDRRMERVPESRSRQDMYIPQPRSERRVERAPDRRDQPIDRPPSMMRNRTSQPQERPAIRQQERSRAPESGSRQQSGGNRGGGERRR